jgi:hypothetical protein
MLKAQYINFLGQTEMHVAVLERLIAELGGDPGWVSPTARLVHAMNQKLAEAVVTMVGSADVLPLEMAMLEAVILAETKDHANWALLSQLSTSCGEGPVRTALEAAVAEVEPQEDGHLEWAKTTWERMTILQAKSKIAMKATEFTEKVLGAMGVGGLS